MKDYFQSHLGAKLLVSYFVIIGLGVSVLIIASQILLPASFNRHMGNNPGGGMGMGMGNGNPQGGEGGGMSQLYLEFRASFNEALIYAAITAMIVAILLSLLLSRSVLGPLRNVSLVTQRIAEGHYSERVQVKGKDELAQLAMRFNNMAEKLEMVEAMRRRLIGDVSHELRTPLTAIKGSMEGLMDGVLLANDETYTEIYHEVDRLNRLVDDLQELSRVEARAFQLNLRRVDIAPLVQVVIAMLASKAESKRITLDFEAASGLPPVLADEDRVIQILTNLTDNALKYTPEGGRVTILANQQNDEALLSVRDSGVGISAEHLPYIFDRFYRVDKSRSRQNGGGSGIGLSWRRAGKSIYIHIAS
jgi:two-component system sensor histidine kinase BaeS